MVLADAAQLPRASVYSSVEWGWQYLFGRAAGTIKCDVSCSFLAHHWCLKLLLSHSSKPFQLPSPSGAPQPPVTLFPLNPHVCSCDLSMAFAFRHVIRIVCALAPSPCLDLHSCGQSLKTFFSVAPALMLRSWHSDWQLCSKYLINICWI